MFGVEVILDGGNPKQIGSEKQRVKCVKALGENCTDG